MYGMMSQPISSTNAWNMLAVWAAECAGCHCTDVMLPPVDMKSSYQGIGGLPTAFRDALVAISFWSIGLRFSVHWSVHHVNATSDCGLDEGPCCCTKEALTKAQP